MKTISLSALLLLPLALVAGMPGTARAQASVTQMDVQRLQDNIFDASRDVAQVRSRDAAYATQLQSELDDARDESIYLKVKLRKNLPIARTEYTELRDRIENIRSRARGDATGGYTSPPAQPMPTPRPAEPEPRPVPPPPPPPPPRPADPNEIPVGTEFDVRLQNTLNSGSSQVEDRFEATTIVDLRDDRGRVMVPAGSLMRGVVSSVTKATRTERTGKLTIAFDRVTISGRSYPIRATVTQTIESEGIAGEKAKIGVGAGAGAILGAILGGAKGAIAGILVGGGGAIAATEGKDVDLPAGAVLRVRLDSGLSLGK